MARSQGDGYRTWTDQSLNAYKARLDKKLRKLQDFKEKWYYTGCGWVLAEEYNDMVNPNGSYKWNGWEIRAHVYVVRVFPAESVEIKNDKPHVIGWAQFTEHIENDKDKANEVFKKFVKFAKTSVKWYPQDADNAPAFDWEGRKPNAEITLLWDGDTYIYTLVIDGKKVASAYNREELLEDVEKAGAELHYRGQF